MNRLPFNKLTLVILAALVIWGCAADSAVKGPADTAQMAQRPLLRVGLRLIIPP